MIAGAVAVFVLGLAVAGIVVLRIDQEARGRQAQADFVDDRTTRFETRLAGADLVQTDVESLESLLTEIEPIAPARARDGRQRLHARLRGQLTALLEQPRLDEADRRHCEEALAVYESRQSEAAAALRKVYQGRLRDWNPIFDLGPQTAADERIRVFAADRLALKGEAFR